MTDRTGHVAFFDCAASPLTTESVFDVCTDRDFEAFSDGTSTDADGSGKLKRELTYETWHPRLTIYLGEEYGPGYPNIDIALNGPTRQQGFDTAQQQRQWMDAVFALICRLSAYAKPAYAPVYFLSSQNPPVPTTRPIAQDLDRLPQFGVYAPDVLADLGGLEAAFDTPWYVAELTDGRTLVIRAAEPWAESGWRPPETSEHIADARFRTEDDSEKTTASTDEKSDPFAALEPGEYGADVGVHPDDISERFRNEDLQLVRVYRDDQGTLRRADGGAFVRHVVETPDSDEALVEGMLEDVPPAADSEHLLVSALINEAIPSTFVRLDAPDDENVVTKVMALSTSVNKHSLLVSLGRATQHDGFSEGDLQTIEEALDNLADLEDTDGIDQYIRQRLL